MIFNSPFFLFVFLPPFLILYFLMPVRLKISVVLIFSMVFYLWGEPFFFPIMIGLALANAAILIQMQKLDLKPRRKKAWMAAGTMINLGTLLLFKVTAIHLQKVIGIISDLGFEIPGGAKVLLPQAEHLPLGISFFAFQSIAMFVDEYKARHTQKLKFSEILTYLFLFPKVIAGPISGIAEIIPQLRKPGISLENSAKGIRRFMLGFGKKVLIADQLALVTQSGIFQLDALQIPTKTAWLALVCYAFQIFFDFSAYTDMAIGIGQALGLTLPENFNFPYAAANMTEFWRRWHITLSGWFRKYVFFPLERKRRNVKWLSQSINILIVFLLTGLWHGITPPFVVWGLWHGAALALERGKFGRWLDQQPRLIQHGYTLSVILAGWVVFLSPTLQFAGRFFVTLFDFSRQPVPLPFSTFPPFSNFVWFALAAAIFLSIPWRMLVERFFPQNEKGWSRPILMWAEDLMPVAVFIIGIVVQAGTDFVPFIYGDF